MLEINRQLDSNLGTKQGCLFVIMTEA